jgi:hypothetical protein
MWRLLSSCFVLVVCSACWSSPPTVLSSERGMVPGVADYQFVRYTNGSQRIVVWVARPYQERMKWGEGDVKFEAVRPTKTDAWRLEGVDFTPPDSVRPSHSGHTAEWYQRMNMLLAIVEITIVERGLRVEAPLFINLSFQNFPHCFHNPPSSKPKCAMSSSGVPDCPKTSSIPTNSIGTGKCFAKHSATADPMPPRI